MKKSLIASCVFALTLGLAPWFGPQPAMAADEAIKPVVVVSISGYDELINDVAFLGKVSDNPGLEQMLVGTLNFVTQGQGLKGLDTKRPWGVVLVATSVGVQPLIFLPVSDSQQLLTALAPMVGEPRDAGDGVRVIDYAGQKIYLKDQNKWLNFSLDMGLVKSPPADPLKLLGGLDKQYDIAFSVYAQNVPPVYRDMALDQLKGGAQNALKKEDDESEEDFALRKAIVESQIAQSERLIRDTDQLTLGWVIDQAGKSTYLEVQQTAVANTQLAKDMAAYAEASSTYTGFRLPNAAITSGVTMTIPASSMPGILAAIKGFRTKAETKIDKSDRDDATKAALKEVTDQLIEVVRASIATGKTDMASAVVLESSPQFIGGIDVAESAKLEASLKKLADIAAKNPQAPAVTLNAETHAGVKFHKVAVPIPQDGDKKLAKILGSQLDVWVGIGAKSAYLAAGKDSLTTLKKVLDVSGGSPRPVDPLQIIISIESILKFNQVVEPENVIATMLAGELAKTPGKDHVNIVVKPIKNGSVARVSFEEGVVRVLGQVIKVAMGGVGRQGL